MRQIAFILACIVLLPLVEGVNVKYYSPSINQTDCNRQIGMIPQKYFTGVKQVSIMNHPYRAHDGQYYPGQVVVMNGCNMGVLIHELAHHQQWVNKATWKDMLQHRGNFYSIEQEIVFSV